MEFTVPQRINREEILKSHLFRFTGEIMNQHNIYEINNALSQASVQDTLLKDIPDVITYPFTLGQIAESHMTKDELNEWLLVEAEWKRLPTPVFVRVTTETLRKLLAIGVDYFGYRHIFQHVIRRMNERDEHLIGLSGISSMAKLLHSGKEDTMQYVILDGLDEMISTMAMKFRVEKIMNSDHPGLPTSFTLIMSEECNQRCVYCYEPGGKRNKKVMSFETAKVALSRLPRGGKVMFFGGEPMLQIDLMKKICDWGWSERGLTFEIVTNGQITDREFIRDYMRYFTYVQLSLDGPEHAHDLCRGHGSFKRAMEFFNAFYEETGHYPTLHPVLSKATVPYLLDIAKWFHQTAKTIYARTQRTYSLRILPGDAQDWDDDTFNILEEQWKSIKDWYLNERIYGCGYFTIQGFEQAQQYYLHGKTAFTSCGINGCTPSESPEQGYRPKHGSVPFCQAGRTLFAVLPDGSFVPCHHEHWQACGMDNHGGNYVIPPDGKLDSVNHMAMITCNDITPCNTCEQFGCCVCPGSNYFQTGDRTVASENWCKSGKILIQTAKEYVNEMVRLKEEDRLAPSLLGTAVEYLLSEHTKGKEQ